MNFPCSLTSVPVPLQRAASMLSNASPLDQPQNGQSGLICLEIVHLAPAQTGRHRQILDRCWLYRDSELGWSGGIRSTVGGKW